MTPRHIELARHALGLTGERTRSYRNRFVAGKGHADFADWMVMVLEGNAKRLSGNMFSLTLVGARRALRNSESLDSEDFPETITPA